MVPASLGTAHCWCFSSSVGKKSLNVHVLLVFACELDIVSNTSQRKKIMIYEVLYLGYIWSENHRMRKRCISSPRFAFRQMSKAWWKQPNCKNISIKELNLGVEISVYIKNKENFQKRNEKYFMFCKNCIKKLSPWNLEYGMKQVLQKVMLKRWQYFMQ